VRVSGGSNEQTGQSPRPPVPPRIATGVVDEIARRAWLAGGRVLAVRRDDIPGHGPAAAILRYPI
jgi:hypothetical protein